MEEKGKESVYNIDKEIDAFLKSFNQKRKFPDQINEIKVEVHPIFARHIL